MKRIILIEDDSAIRDVVFLALDPGKYEVSTFETGNVLLENQLAVPDLFMLDKNIAGTDGLNLCRFIKTSDVYNHTPVIILSASPNIKELATAADADDAIAKPFTLKALREIIALHISE